MTRTENAKSPFPWGYFVLTFGFSWLVWLPAILANFKIISFPFPAASLGGPLSIIGLFGPMVGACTMIYREEGGAGVKRHLRRLLDVRIRARWWAVIIVLPLSIQAIAHFLPLLTGEPLLGSFISSIPMFFTILLMVTFLGGGQEELGWRGYALDRIQSRFSALVSSLTLGTVWACWHIPLWFMAGVSQGVTPFGPFLLVCVSLSVILAWIYNNTGKSMVAAMLTHGMVNAGHPLFPVIMSAGTDQHLYVYWAITVAVAAIVITLVWGPGTLTGGKQDLVIQEKVLESSR